MVLRATIDTRPELGADNGLVWVAAIVRGIWSGLAIGGVALAGITTGSVPLIPGLIVLILSIVYVAWRWEQMREYNRGDRY